MYWLYYQAVKSNLPGKWFCNVDSIRFILAFVVMLSHSNLVYVVALKHSGYLLLRLIGYFLANAFDGTSAVIAFFVISGFVIHYPNKSGIPNLTKFWIRRFVRIIVPLLSVIIIGIFFNHPEKRVLWSLYCEMIYYAAYPFLSYIKASWKSKLIGAYAVLAVIICLIAYHDFDAVFKKVYDNYHSFFMPLQMLLMAIELLPCWLLGVIIAEQIDDLNSATFKSLVIYRLLVFIASWCCSVGKFHFHVHYMISLNIFALLLFKWIKAEVTYFKHNSPNPILEKMGEFSYSLYLCHPLMYFILSLFITNTFFTYPILILITITGSYCFYLLVEKPSHLLAQKVNSKINYVAK
jgi:peptidoglycan/LPS O-acetylase OafA/YrhL